MNDITGQSEIEMEKHTKCNCCSF